MARPVATARGCFHLAKSERTVMVNGIAASSTSDPDGTKGTTGLIKMRAYWQFAAAVKSYTRFAVEETR
jgi:hypothetical protein